MRHDLEVLAQAHEREVARRDATIASLLGDLDEAEAQFERALRGHLRAIDRLVDIQDGRLLSLEADFQREVRAIEEEFAAERATILADHDRFKAELQHTIKAVREEEQGKTAAAQAEFEQVREALKRRALERIHVLESDQDGIMEGLEKRLEEAHLTYLTNTDARSADFKVLSERGQADTQMNERQQRALKRLNKLLQLWRSKMGNNVRECEERNEALEEERTEVAKHLDKLKSRMGQARGAYMSKMKAMSATAQEAKQTLTDNTALAQRLLTQAEALRALESASEKIDPFAPTRGTLPSLAAGPGAEALAAAKMEGAGTIVPSLAGMLADGGAGAGAGAQEILDLPQALVAPGTETGLAEAESLHHFYGRYNKALMESLALERQRDALKAERAELQNVLQQALDGLAVTPSAVDGANSLLVVNGRVPLNKAVPVKVTPKTLGVVTVEAALVATSYAKAGHAMR